VYKRDAAGVETLIRDEYSDPFTDSTPVQQGWMSATPNTGVLLATDRLVTKVYVQRYSGGGSGTVVTTYWEGTAHASQIQTTITTGAQGPAGPGVAAGGTSGQVLSKKTNADYDTQWVAAGGGGGGHTIQDEGGALTARTGLNFVGPGVTATDDAANGRTNVVIPATLYQPDALVAEEFLGDLSGYTHDSGAASDWTVSGGVAIPKNVLDKRIIRAGLVLADSIQYLKYRHTAVGAGDSVGLIARRLDAQNAIVAIAHDSSIYIFALDANNYVQKATASITGLTAVGPWYWLRLAIDKGLARLDWFTAHPRASGAAQTTSWTIDIAKFQSGVSGGVGIRSTGNNDREIDRHEIGDLSGIGALGASAVAGGIIPVVTALPAAPVDGQEIYFKVSEDTMWHLRYNATATAPYRWVYIGGAPLNNEVVTSANETTSSTAFVALTTPGPIITLPLAGEYDIETSMLCWHSVQNGRLAMSYDIGATAALGTDGAESFAPAAGLGGLVVRRVKRKTFSAPAVLTAKYATSAATMTVGGTAAPAPGAHRLLRATPVRVG